MIVEAICKQSAKGFSFGGPTIEELKLAVRLIKNVSSLDKIRFTCSGSEAVLHALRLARIYTGKDSIAKFEGGYHGWVDQHDNPEIDFIVLSYNNIQRTVELIQKNLDQLAAIIVEPMLGAGGMIPARKEFLEFLRKTTSENNLVLIFDEIITYRYGFGGAQGQYKIEPDLTTFGKLIGGGLPIGAFGGKQDIMSLLKAEAETKYYKQSGTFAGNPLSMAAGLATLKYLTKDIFSRLNQAGEYLRSELNSFFKKNEMPVQVTGDSSLLKFHFTADEIIDYRSSIANARKDLLTGLYFTLLEEGILISPRGLACLSEPMGVNEIEAFISAVQKSIKKIL